MVKLQCTIYYKTGGKAPEIGDKITINKAVYSVTYVDEIYKYEYLTEYLISLEKDYENV